MNTLTRTVLATAAVYAAVGVGSAAASTEPPDASGDEATAAPQLPTEFTACVNPGPQVTSGTDERVEGSSPDGDTTIVRRRGFTWRLQVSDVSESRLDGSWYHSYDSDDYTLSGDEPGPTIATFTNRIENDEGAWQGSAVSIEFPDGTFVDAPLVMFGEGAYEGLTAVIATGDFADEGVCPNTRGYIVEVPAPPVPYTGE